MATIYELLTAQIVNFLFLRTGCWLVDLDDLLEPSILVSDSPFDI